jgi:transcriptional regulator with GAF, ATPase, and Fis domain/tetratricopeptide (TPR) repeat protein
MADRASLLPASLPSGQPEPGSETTRRSLVALHEHLAGQSVAVLVGAETTLRAAAAAHVERFLALRGAGIGPDDGRPLVTRVRALRADHGELVDAIGRALGVTLESTRVGHVAERLGDRLRRGRTSVVVTVEQSCPSVTGWAFGVLRELAAAVGPESTVGSTLARLVLVAPPSCAVVQALAIPTFALDPVLDPDELRAWIDVVARTAGRALAGGPVALPGIERALERARVALRDVVVVEELEQPIDPASLEDESSPWTWLRRAQRAVDLRDEGAADRAIAIAEARADEPDARRDLGRRWAEFLDDLPPGERLGYARRSTVRALSAADADEAVRWANVAVRAGELAQVGPEETATLLEAQGRALVAKGDVVMARAVLDRARERGLAGNIEKAALASIAIETAEAAYLAGDLASAEGEIRRALSTVEISTEVRLRARNVLGKLFLARGLWDQADAHFAADASEAARIGDRLAELRALLNRAIGLLYAERFDEAEGLFEVVLEGGRAIDDPRAIALALENLAIIAQSHRRDYATALERYRAAVAGLKKTGQAAMLARAAYNLGALYLRLGDLQQAQGMVRFAASLFRRGLAALVVAEGDDLRARIAARMGRSEEALAAISRAREILRAAGDPPGVADCDRFEARLALDDGDVRGARLALDRARGAPDQSRGRAEQALLEAEWLRANGEAGPAILVAAREALALCRASTDEDLIVEAHLLIAEVARVASDRELLQRHLEAAGAVRDTMLRSIPEGFHAAFLGRPDMIRVAKLERHIETEPLAPIVPATASESAGARIRGPITATEPRKIVGVDPALRALLSAVRRVAGSDTTVLIRGESGTGKELVAEALHFASDRATGPLVKVNCAALVETLLLSELFGHEKGAFTGAVARRRGRFELADGGTLFLDEIGDISPRTQVALLRVLQEKTFERVGGTTPIRVDVRVVCATHRDLATMVQRGEFREDLFYRLRGVQLDVPPLRARLGDLGELCDAILRRIAAEHGQPLRSVGRDALDLLSAHKWPGNVRELENVLRAVALLADGDQIGARDLVEHVDVFRGIEATLAAGRAPSASVPPPPSSLRPSMPIPPSSEEPEGEEDGGALPPVEATATAIAYGQIRTGGVSLFEMKRMIERDCIARALAETRGNITRAAAILGMKRPRLSQLVKHYGLSALFTEGS